MRKFKWKSGPLGMALYNDDEIKRQLEAMAKNGWLLVSASQVGWLYKRVEPQGLEFGVTYYPRTTNSSEISKKLQDYIDRCSVLGWEFVTSYQSIVIFKNESFEPVPFETDTAIEIETVNKAFKKSMRFEIIAFIILVIVSIWILSALSTNLLDYISIKPAIALMFYMPIYSVCLIFETFMYFRWYKNAKRLAETENRKLTPYDKKEFKYSRMLLLFAVITTALISGGFSTSYILVLFGYFISYFLTRRYVEKNFDKPKGKYNNISMYFTGYAIAVVMVINTIMLVGNNIYYTFIRESYDYNGWQEPIYKDEIPLKIDDLIKINYDEYQRREKFDNSTFLARYLSVEEYPRLDALDNPSLKYSVVEVKYDFLFETCFKDITKKYTSMSELDYGLDNVDKIYQCFDKYETYNYIVLYENYIIEVVFDYELDKDQMRIVIDKLI